MKNKYDSSVVFLYLMGKEALLPHSFRKQIPYSTICSWRKTDSTSYLGHEFRYFFTEAFTGAEVKLKVLQQKKLLHSIARSWITLSHIILPLVKSSNNNKEAQFKILTAISYLKDQFGIDRTLKLIGLSKPLYYQWVLEARFECFDSYTQLCTKRHPQQLELKEIEKIKSLLLDHETNHWPICSIQANALRKKQLVASLYSWYKYARMWGIKKKLTKKQHKTIGIISTAPNEYLHVDTTFYPLIDGKQVAISFVMDNYSKMILGFHVSQSNNFEIVRRSLSNALKVIATHPDQKHSFLVTDGGKENHNQYIDAFISKLSKHKITKIRALKDIRFSNSPVEAVHRTIKGRYLKNRKFESIRALHTYLKWVVEDYNKVRPHYKHRPRTPFEVYFNMPLDFDVRKRIKSAISKRVKNNKCSKCIQCTGCRTIKPKVYKTRLINK
ncbi:MAG: DDE-type integrase/transposase/recombinase [Sphingobacteriaceae bacterium]|nr:DDE-type integrase/transposase/recombinase [Sphingobacteriaceae bacterium]